MTDSKEIYKVLNVRCQGGHEHEPVLGGGVGGNKSRLAEHYTTELVRTILSAYRRTLQEPRTMVSVMTLDEYLHECYIVDQIIKQETDENEVAKNTAVLQNDQVSQSNEMISNERATVEKEVLTNDIYHEAEEEGAEEREEAEAVNPDDEEEERYRPLPRERPFSLARLVKRAHDGLGHPFKRQGNFGVLPVRSEPQHHLVNSGSTRWSELTQLGFQDLTLVANNTWL